MLVYEKTCLYNRALPVPYSPPRTRLDGFRYHQKHRFRRGPPGGDGNGQGYLRRHLYKRQGIFSTDRTRAFPLTLVVSSVGFGTQEVAVPSNEAVNVSMDMAPTLGQEVVVSATRVPVRILESPVSIERLGHSDILQTPAASFYDALGHLKGVDVVNSSLTFTTLGTRGFNGSGNLRMNQLTDGMDNQAPGLNFSVGNIVGLTELDVDNVELLPGASSALYGSGGMNGTVLITSKDPFRYQGLSVQVKQGVNHLGDPAVGAKPYYDWQARYAHAFNNRFAFKLSGEYTKAEDWHASDGRNYSLAQGQPIAGDRNLVFLQWRQRLWGRG